MYCNPENYLGYIELKMHDWAQLATWGINARDRARGRKNLAYLVNNYPSIAESLGLADEPVVGDES